MKYFLTSLCMLCLTLSLTAQQWEILPSKALPPSTTQLATPSDFRAFEFEDYTSLIQGLTRSAVEEGRYRIVLPTDPGKTEAFLLTHKPVLPDELARKYPGIHAFTGASSEDATTRIKLTIGENGLRAYIRRQGQKDLFIDPYRQENDIYRIYYYKDYPGLEEFNCLTEESSVPSEMQSEKRAGDCLYREYDIAVAAAGEYTQAHGGTVGGALAAINTTINNLNAVLEEELGVTFVLIPNNNLIIYTNPNTDPYASSMGNTLLSQNQSNINSVIGSANYDIGHVFHTAGGGIASLGVPCRNTAKARGASGLSTPEGPNFDINIVAHEVGHQFGATHTYNNSCGSNRTNSTAYEPGSGSTIMSYAGVCPPNVQGGADPYYHASSLAQMHNYVSNGSGNNCPTILSSANNAPTVNAGLDYTIPKSTPFELSATGSDPDGDPVTYVWEQYNNGIATQPPVSSSTAGPMVRSVPPTPSPDRAVGIGLVDPVWEVLPSVGRTMTFRTTIRDFDSSAGYGCVDEDNMVVSVSGQRGPFVVSSPNGGESWEENSTQTVTWQVAGTNLSPVNAAEVDILLSLDGGLTYPFTLADETANDGSAQVTVPNNVESSTARIKVVGADNIFFDVSDNNFYVGPPVLCNTYVSSDVPINISPSSVSTYFSDLVISDPGEIVSIKVTDVQGTHSWISDLTFTLVSPSGAEYELISGVCNDDEDFDFEVEEGGGIHSCPLTGGQTISPDDSFAPLIGTEQAGTWRLKIFDSFAADGGQLTSWSLDICVYEQLPPCSDTDLTFDAGLIQTGLYEASNSITASTSLAGGTDVTFGSSLINLDEGFFVPLGAEFLATEANCE